MAIRTTPNTSRRPTGDTATTARKRFYRAAERKLKEAERAVGVTAERLRYLARKDLESALNTYSKKTTQQFSKPIQAIAAKLGVNLSEERQKIKERSDKQAERIRTRSIRLDEESRSTRRLEASLNSVNARREAEAQAVFNSRIGERIFGGTVDLWRDVATEYRYNPETEREEAYVNKHKIYPELLKFFNADNLADLLKAVEDVVGTSLYASEKSEEMYETVKITLQSYVISDNSVIS